MDNSKKYTIDYFIKKFSAIPEDQWCTGEYVNLSGQRCAFGHCGILHGGDENDEADALIALLNHKVVEINDNTHNGSPKHNILLALEARKKSLKNGKSD